MAYVNRIPDSPVVPDMEALGRPDEGFTARVSDDIMTGGGDPAGSKRYAGFKWIAGLLGFAVAMFFLAVFLGVASVVMSLLGYQPASGTLTAMVSATGTQVTGVAVLVATLLAYVIGGYAAGRLARYGGGRNGLGVVLWTVIVAVAVAIAAVVLQLRFGLNQVLHTNLGLSASATHIVAAVVMAVVVLVVMIIGALVGGALGMRYHRRVDRAVGVIA